MTDASRAAYLYVKTDKPSFRGIGRVIGRDYKLVARKLKQHLPDAFPVVHYLDLAANVPRSDEERARERVYAQFRRHWIIWQLITYPRLSVRSLESRMRLLSFKVKKIKDQRDMTGKYPKKITNDSSKFRF
jgi:hypothetical protein